MTDFKTPYPKPTELELQVLLIKHEIEYDTLIPVGTKVIGDEDGENETQLQGYEVPFGTGEIYGCESVGVVIGYCQQRYEEKLAYIVKTSKGTSIVRPKGLKIEPE